MVRVFVILVPESADTKSVRDTKPGSSDHVTVYELPGTIALTR